MPTEDASNIYTFNTNIEFKDVKPFGLHIDLKGGSDDSRSKSKSKSSSENTKFLKKFIDRLFSIIGEFMSFLVVNRIKFDHHICRSILARLMYDDNQIHDEEYVLFHFMDYPGFGQTMLGLLEHPENFDTQMEFARYDVKQKNSEGAIETVPVTFKNFQAFLIENAKDTLIAKKDKMYMDALRKGFLKGIRRKAVLYHIKINLADFDTLLTGSKISPASIIALVDKVNDTSTINAGNDKNRRNLLEWFCNILLECIGSNNKINKTNTLFIKKLLMYWTGVSSYNSWFQYTVTFHDGYGIRSATCGKILKLSTYKHERVKMIQSKEDLLEQLKIYINIVDFNDI